MADIAFYCTETGWGCGSSFQAKEEVRAKHGEDADDENLFGKIKSYLRDVNEGDGTDIRTSTGKLGDVGTPSTERVTGS